MKRKLLLVLFAALICLFVCACGVDDDVNEYVYPDYPLVEYTFSDTDEWIVVICEDVYGDDGEYYINSDEASLENNKEKLVVNIYPQELSSPAEHLVWIYKNGELLEYVACSDYEFLSDAFENDFKEVSYEIVADLINF